MKFNYFPETNSLYINLSENSSVESKEISNGIVLDFDKEGNLVGIDIDNTSKIVDLSKIESTTLPLSFLAGTS